MTETEDRDFIMEVTFCGKTARITEATLCGRTACAEYRAELEAENEKLRARCNIAEKRAEGLEDVIAGLHKSTGKEKKALRAELAALGWSKCCVAREHCGHLYPCPYDASETIGDRRFCPEHAREKCCATTEHYVFTRSCHRKATETHNDRRYCWEHAREAVGVITIG